MPGSGSQSYASKTDEQLALLAQQGDGEAERALVERLLPIVQLKCRRFFLIGGDKADLEQEGSIGLLSAIRDFDPERNVTFRSYADVCISNNVFAAIRRFSRKKHSPLNSSYSLDSPIKKDGESVTFGENLGAPESSGPEALAIRRAEEAEFVSSLKRVLTDFEYEVLLLFLDGKSYQQIADELGRGRKAVDNALQRAKKKIAALIGRHE